MLQLLAIARIRLDRQPTRQQIVASVAGFDPDDIANTTQVGDVLA